MDFSSDTSAPAHPRVLNAMARVNHSMAPSYGGDALTLGLRDTLETVFETKDFDYWLCASGTAANALALSVLCPSTGAILCHREAHIERDERGAPEFFTHGAKLSLLPGENGQIDEEALRDALAAIDHGFVHRAPAHVLSLTNLTEAGTAYTTAQVARFSALAHEAGLSVHLDGARFANALVSTGASPAEMSWKAGVDALTLGLTKTGAIGCEIILLFGDARERFGELTARAKRSGHMPPKMRYLAAQAHALLGEDLWLQLASNANKAARDLSNRLCAQPGTSLLHPVHGNEVFVRLPGEIADAFSAGGAKFYPWIEGSYRFVCHWQTARSDLDALTALLPG